MPINKSILEINRVLDHQSDNFSRLMWACNRIGWLARYRKVSKELTDALAVKAAAIMDGSWYGIEPEEAIIKKYLK